MTEESIPTHDQLAGAIVKLRDEIKRIQKEADKKIKRRWNLILEIIASRINLKVLVQKTAQ